MATTDAAREEDPRTGAGLTRTQIIQSAIALMDDEGVDALTIRALGRRLDVESAALYWHISNKDEICRAIVDSISAQLRVDISVKGTPRLRLERHLAAMRDHWKGHPSVLELSRRFTPTVGQDVVAMGIALLVELGIPPEDALDN